jgi:hypothetical protein
MVESQTFTSDSHPAAILDAGEHVFEDCVFTATNAWEVLVVRGATVTLRRCRIVDGMNRGVSVEGGRVILEDCEILRNRLGVFVTGDAAVDVIRCRVEGPGSCGILYHKGASGLVEDCHVSQVADGALVIRDATPRVVGGSFSAANMCFRSESPGGGELVGCRLGPGGVGVWICAGANPVLRDCVVFGNATAGAWLEGDGEFSRCVVEDNAMGVCLAGGANPLFTDCDLRGGPNMAVHPLPGAKGRFFGCRITGDFYDGVVTGAWASTIFA